ncbi:MAG: Rrf2 family transcriptional regulator [Candidatus Omnitrophica bacterium]|nr:Rrf2 family transcriptional regulator [Candidatus Omnitrophota bacterium]
MKLITRDTDYAIRAMCVIAKRKDKVVSVKDLTDYLKVPRPFLRKILQILNKRGLLKSYKGIGGGFTIALSPKKISLVKLIEVFQGPIRLSEHKLKKKICPEAKICLLKKRLDNIEKYVKARLEAITLETLIEEAGRI